MKRGKDKDNKKRLE